MGANVKNAMNQGGELWEIEGEIDIKSGGILDIKSGGFLKVNGADITTSLDELAALNGLTASVTELNYIDTSVPGTAVASKALVLGANKNVDMLAVADGGLALGAGAGTAISATAAEINKLDGAPLAATFVIGAEGGNVINVGIQLKDANGTDLAVRGHVRGYLSDDATGDIPCVTNPNGGFAIGTDGALIGNAPQIANGVILDGDLQISAVPEKFKTTKTAVYTINGISRTKAATDNLVFSDAHVITAAKFGCILLQINSAGTVSTKVVGTPQAYNDAPTALAALPSPDAGNVTLGYIAIENNAGDWTANTDDLTNASDVTTAAFTDATEVTLNTVPKVFDLISESDGDIDINITETGVDTWYLNLLMPDGRVITSSAIAFT